MPPDAHTIERPANLEMPLETFLAWDHEGGLAEWIDGRAYLHVSDTWLHQQVLSFLVAFLRAVLPAVDGGVIGTAPYPMRARPDGPIREPDLVTSPRTTSIA